MDAKTENVLRLVGGAAEFVRDHQLKQRVRAQTRELRRLERESRETERRIQIIESRQRFEKVATWPAERLLSRRGELLDRLRPFAFVEPGSESFVAALLVGAELDVYLLATGEPDAVIVDTARLHRLLLANGRCPWFALHNHFESIEPSDVDTDLAMRLFEEFGCLDFGIVTHDEAWSMVKDRVWKRRRYS